MERRRNDIVLRLFDGVGIYSVDMEGVWNHLRMRDFT